MSGDVNDPAAVNGWTLPYPRTIIGVVIFVVLVSAVAIYAWKTNPVMGTEFQSAMANRILFEQQWYAQLFLRYTVTDWALGLLAAGSAIAAAVKNALTTKDKAVATAAGETSRVDGVIVWLAALTIVATTLDAKIHPSMLSERYRKGDLILQDALMKYRDTDKNKDEDTKLLTSWLEAQAVLEGAVPTVSQLQTKASGIVLGSSGSKETGSASVGSAGGVPAGKGGAAEVEPVKH